MSLLLVVLALVALLLLLSQFGGQLSAQHAFLWWLGLGFLMWSAVWPGSLRPVADALGIEFVSNFVLASMLIFLLYQVLELVAATTGQSRRLRELSSRGAAERFLAREKPRGEAPRPEVLVVVPCYNEREALPATLRRLTGLAPSHPEIVLCVVDDGSTDGSGALLAELAPGSLASHHTNLGVGGVLLTGIRVAEALGCTYLVQCDADGQHPPERIPDLVREATARGADLMVGSRFIAGAEGGRASTTLPRRFGMAVIRTVLFLFGRRAALADPTSGFRAYSQRAWRALAPRMPDEFPEPETLALVALAGGVLAEMPVSMSPRAGGTSTLAGLRAARYMVKVATALIGLRLRSLWGKPG
jgi:hypothetical protein